MLINITVRPTSVTVLMKAAVQMLGNRVCRQQAILQRLAQFNRNVQKTATSPFLLEKNSRNSYSAKSSFGYVDVFMYLVLPSL